MYEVVDVNIDNTTPQQSAATKPNMDIQLTVICMNFSTIY